MKTFLSVRPLLVKLQGENRPLSADTSYELSCSVYGSRPPATITWWKGSTPMTNTREAVSFLYQFIFNLKLKFCFCLPCLSIKLVRGTFN